MSVSCTEKNHILFEYEWSTGRTYEPAWILYCRGDGMAVTFIPKPQTAQLQYKAGGLGCVCVCFREVFLQMNKIILLKSYHASNGRYYSKS